MRRTPNLDTPNLHTRGSKDSVLGGAPSEQCERVDGGGAPSHGRGGDPGGPVRCEGRKVKLGWSL